MKIKLGVLTSSRADYGIYKPLLVKLSKDQRFDLVIIVFGMHLHSHHGTTINAILKDNLGKIVRVEGMPKKDTPLEISKGYGQLITTFAKFWNENKFDNVLALGDRFEMSAAVQAGIPFRLLFSHLHGGETTLGAIDNIYRHQITLASKIHFVATHKFVSKVEEITGSANDIYDVGALSIDGIETMNLPSWADVRKEFQIPVGKFILVTFHPETVAYEKNRIYCKEAFDALEMLCKKFHVVITLANADTLGSLYRDAAISLKAKYPQKISLVYSFGKENYFAAMKASEMLLGNTSSGILEAASFQKYAINVGSRQEGRMRSKNVIDVPFDKEEIIKSTLEVAKGNVFLGKNEYYKENTANNIIEILANERF